MTKKIFFILSGISLIIIFLLYIANRNYNRLGAYAKQLEYQLYLQNNQLNSQ